MTMRLNYGVAAPEAVKALMALEDTVKSMGLEPKLIHLIKLRASQINGCAYCINMHNQEARADGETQQRLDLLSVWRETNFFDEREKAALAWTEAVTLIAETNAPDAEYDALAAVFDESRTGCDHAGDCGDQRLEPFFGRVPHAGAEGPGMSSSGFADRR